MKLIGQSNTGENELANLCQALADPLRVRLLRLLAVAECTVTQLCDSIRRCAAASVSQPMISHHLGQLRVCGLVTARQKGRWRSYCLAGCVKADSHGLVIQLGPISITLSFKDACDAPATPA
jgi:DNA-binding transcriptional ArsR family regulator